MTITEVAIAILKDAVQAFRCKSETISKGYSTPETNNHAGLCYFIHHHELIDTEDFDEYEMGVFILNFKWKGTFAFCGGKPQMVVWDNKSLMHLCYERSNWCKKRIKELKAG